MKEIVRYPHCFVCGDQNEQGLKAKFFYDDEEAFCEIVATESFEGYRGIYHGGVLSALLDEVMVKTILANDRYAVTAEMTIRFHVPVRVGDRLKFRGRINRKKGRVFLTEGSVTTDGGEVVASATGKYVEADLSLKDQLMQSIDQ